MLAELRARQHADVDWRGGRVFSLVYHASDAHEQLSSDAHALYASANLLNPMAFESLKQLESEIVATAGALFHHPGAVGAVTSGGTESILCAVAAYRDRARRRKPWILWPSSSCRARCIRRSTRPRTTSACKLVKVDVGRDQRADVRAMAKAIGWRTIGLVASAPQYPHGVVDPIAEIGCVAEALALPFHVDACVGGFVLPWLERLGRRCRGGIFACRGVTSISADLHKFAYAAKGASLLLWRSLDRL